MAVNNKSKYIYSAPDRREYLFDRIADPLEMRSRANVVFCRDTLHSMRDNILSYYRRENYTEPIESENWRLFPQPELLADPDAGLLIQDPPWADAMQVIPGYTD